MNPPAAKLDTAQRPDLHIVPSGPEWVMLDEIERLMETCLLAFPGMSAAAIVVEGSQRIIGARSARISGTPVGVLQMQAEIGSTLAICDTDQYAFVDFHRHERQWPAFTRRARQLGFASVHIIPLAAHGAAVGTLSLFAQDVLALTTDQLRLAQRMSDRAARVFLRLATGAG